MQKKAFAEDSKYELIKHGNDVSYRLAFLYRDAYSVRDLLGI